MRMLLAAAALAPLPLSAQTVRMTFSTSVHTMAACVCST